MTVLIGHILSLQPRGGQLGGIGGATDGARELIGNPRRSLAVIVDRIGGGPTQVLLVAVHISVSKTAIHVRARDGGRLPQ